VVNLSHLWQPARDALEPWATGGEVDFLVEQPEPFGTGGTLAALRARLEPTVLTHNADVLTDLEPSRLLSAHERLGAPATVAVRRVESGADFRLDGEHVTGLVDRRARPQEPGWLFLGIAAFRRSALSLLPERRPVGLTEGLLLPLIEQGEVAAVEHPGYALDVGTIDRYLRASLDALEGRGRRSERGWPGEIVPVAGGRAYRGRGARAPRHVLGPGAILLAGSEVEQGARVDRSIVWPGAVVPAGTHLRDEVYAPSGS
jgi:mannose-1-phosphate guanylyltransferase